MKLSGKQKLELLIGLMFAAVIVLYWPHGLYIGSKLGLTASPRIASLQIHTANGWFPVITSESALWRTIHSQTLHNTLFLFRIDGLKPGLAGSMSVRQLSPGEMEQQLSRPVCGKKDLAWGEAIRICSEQSSKLFIIPKLSVGLVVDNEDDLKSIVSVIPEK